jgi:hypothetical protein
MSPASSAFAITPHDTDELVRVTRGIYVGVAGDVTVKMFSDDIVTFKDLAAGVIHPIRVKLVYDTGTDATDIVGVY